MAYTCLSPSLAKTVQILLWPCTKRLQCSLFVEVFIWLVQLPPPAALGSLQPASVCAVLMAVKPLLMSYTTRIPRDACFYTKITFFFFLLPHASARRPAELCKSWETHRDKPRSSPCCVWVCGISMSCWALSLRARTRVCVCVRLHVCQTAVR